LDVNYAINTGLVSCNLLENGNVKDVSVARTSSTTVAVPPGANFPTFGNTDANLVLTDAALLLPNPSQIAVQCSGANASIKKTAISAMQTAHLH
jgi:hypothetical protein